MKKLSEMLNEYPDCRDHVIELYNEYMLHASDEAKYVKNLDLLDMFMQAYEYEQLNPHIDLSEFFSKVPIYLEEENNFFEPNLKQLLKELSHCRSNKIKTIPNEPLFPNRLEAFFIQKK
jgi:5'-deoxynucleotidase YfbR-like HD superfamily hydrolase